MPHSDSAYVSVAAYTTAFTGGQEVLSRSLSQPLVSGAKYRVSLWASPTDAYNYITCCLGVRFTPVPMPPFSQNLSDVELIIPENEIDTSLWYHLEGVYTAQGGENKIYIANFRPDSESNPIYQGEITPDYNSAGFYIDDVSVTEDTVTGVEEKDETHVNLYFDKAQGRLSVNSPKKLQITVYDISGRAARTGTGSLDVSGLNGVYVVQVIDDGLPVHTEKMGL